MLVLMGKQGKHKGCSAGDRSERASLVDALIARSHDNIGYPSF